jgi:NAD-dependent DNA ligase
MTKDKVRKAMMTKDLKFEEIYWEELKDCVEDLKGYVKKKKLLTEKEIKENGFRNLTECLKSAPSIATTFGEKVLDIWIGFFFEEQPEILELVGIIAKQENQEADPEVITQMIGTSNTKVMAESESKGPLSGIRVVFTGASSHFKGEGMEIYLEKKGAITSHNVTSKVDILVTGDRPAISKLQKAKILGVKVMKEDEFWKEYRL